MEAITQEHTGAENVRWDLTDLFPSVDALRQEMHSSAEAARSFEDRYRSRVKDLEPPDLNTLLEEFESLNDRFGRVYAYVYLNWSTDTTDPSRGALLQEVREAYASFSQRLVFFEVEWAALSDEVAQRRAAELPRYRHFLELQTLRRQHVLSEPEEKLLAETDVTGRSAWVRFFDQTLGATTFELRGETLTQQQILAKLHDGDRSLRRDAALSFTDGLERLEPQLTFVFNTVLADTATQDRIRGYPHWLAARNLSNEVDDDSVQALVDAVTSRYDLPQRFYHLKKRLLGFDELYDYDRYAQVGEADTKYTWDEARDLVLDAYRSFHPQVGEIVGRFFDERWIDAALGAGKRGGAFSHGVVPSAHPYILMNYTGRVRDVQTLAHELGHGVHQYLSREQGLLHADTPLTTAETASVFGEALTYQRLLHREEDPSQRLALLVARIDDTMATVFRQVSMNRFEHAIHTERRQRGELSPDRFGELWMETQHALYGDSVALGAHYTHWWSYIPHFLHTPGYVYAYAFGELLVLALYNRYQREGGDFAERYFGLLRAGGSDWPHHLVAPLGVDLTDPEFWSEGLASIEAMIVEAEQLSVG